jgi:hypothetical protein
MRTAIRKALSLGLATAFCLGGIVSCGSSTNNDQGTSFTALGYTSDGTGDAGFIGTPLPAFTDVPFSGGSDSLLFYPNGLAPFIALQNNLTQQHILVKRVDCAYSIPGSTVSIPDNSTVVAGYLAATGGGEGTSTEYLQFPALSAEIVQFINVNQNNIPELPVDLNMTCTAVGVSQAGDVLETNPVNMIIVLYDIPEFASQDFIQGAGTGGTFDSFSQVVETTETETATATTIEE